MKVGLSLFQAAESTAWWNKRFKNSYRQKRREGTEKNQKESRGGVFVEGRLKKGQGERKGNDRTLEKWEGGVLLTSGTRRFAKIKTISSWLGGAP